MLSLRRRDWLAAGAAAALTAKFPAHALPPQPLVFPRDFGAHPDLRTEWWYITGHAERSESGGSQAGRAFGFQLTFFRTRVDAAQSLQSKFAARQLIFAHAAITDVAGQKLWHDQRIARAGFGQAFASEQDTDLKLGDWTLQRAPGPESSAYRANLTAREFALALDFVPSQPLILQGHAGLSRKGPQARQASYYYTKPQLATSGELTLRGQQFKVQGKAWLDHEWSEELLHPDARGWDWIGMNLDDGSALTAFQLRNAAGGAVWDGGSFRSSKLTTGQDRSKDSLHNFSRGDVLFKPVRFWTSPLTQARYPVEWVVRTPAATYTVKAVLDNQELDSRQSTGAVYWEGLSDLFDSNNRRVGRGYLEMTGYASPLRL